MKSQRPFVDRNWFIYTLKLEHDCWYVGRTRNPVVRIETHISGTGAAWTALHKPISVSSVVSDCTRFDEDAAVLKLMSEKGIQLVRGGIYSSPHLSNDDLFQITKHIQGATDCCYTCGKPGHFARDCRSSHVHVKNKRPSAVHERKNKREVEVDVEVEVEVKTETETEGENTFRAIDNDDDENDDTASAHEPVCDRCGRASHSSDKCFARRHADGSELPRNDQFRCYRCHRKGHSVSRCHATTYENGEKI